MNKSSVLVLTNGKVERDRFEGLCTVAAKRGLHLSVVVLGRLPMLPIYATGMGDFATVANYGDWQRDLEQAQADLDAAARELKAFVSERGAACDVSALSAEPAAFPDALARRALTCDLVVILGDLRSERELFDDAIGAVLFRAPVPVVLNTLHGDEPLLPKRVLIGWNSGVPASRAIRAALPMLRAADEVIIALFDPVMTTFRDGENPGSDVAHWLSHHGCNVTVRQIPSGGKEIADCLITHAKETEANLIVMGAYDHSRMRQFVFGGTTRSMIEQTEIPVLMAH